MPKYLIERKLPALGQFTPEQLQRISQRPAGLPQNPQPEVEWLQSYIAGHMILSIYVAPNEHLIRKYAVEAGFSPAQIYEIADSGSERRRGQPSKNYAA
jgi:Protein of unknown function (DUF4242)